MDSSRVIVVSHEQVVRLLPMRECIEVMEGVLRDLADGEIFNPLRQAIRPPASQGLLGLMPAYRAGEHPLFALKEVCVFAGNPARGLDSHLGTVVLHSAETGELLAILNASAITAIRTAAVSAVATRLLARADARTLAVIGTGRQARSHVEAVSLVRPFAQVRVAGSEPGNAQRFCDEVTAHLRVSAAPFATVAEAVDGADVIVTATDAKEPILEKEWVAGGAHINAVGSSAASAREISSELMAAVSLFVDRRESALNESGDILVPMREGKFGEGHIRGEIGEVLTGARPGRRSEEEITLFKSLGLAAEDLAAAWHVYQKAKDDTSVTRVVI